MGRANYGDSSMAERPLGNTSEDGGSNPFLRAKLYFMAVLGITYNDGGKPLNYEHVYLHARNIERVFDTGDFVKDWFNAKQAYVQDIQNKEPYLSHSSTVDHFIMDGAEYDSAYLHFKDDEPVLLYMKETDDPAEDMAQRYIYEDGWEFFVNKGERPTWEELKAYCKPGNGELPTIYPM